MSLLWLLTAACAHASGAPAPPQQPSAAGATPQAISAEERNLYDIILKLATDPNAQLTLAPSTHVIYHGEQDVDELMANAVEQLGWVAQAHPTLVPHEAPAQEADATLVRCFPAGMRCDIEQAGGVTKLTFAYQGSGADRRMVLSQIDSSEP